MKKITTLFSTFFIVLCLLLLGSTKTFAETNDKNANAVNNKLPVSINSIKIDNADIYVNLSEDITDLTLNDFNVTATTFGAPYDLCNLRYDSYRHSFSFLGIQYAYKSCVLSITISAAKGSTKVTGSASDQITINAKEKAPTDTGKVEIALTWGATPYDLDAHLILPNGEEVCWLNSEVNDNQTGEQIANLNQDCTYGYGPEIITINKLTSGKYTYYVDAWSSNSFYPYNAKVVIKADDKNVATYSVPNGLEGRTWEVFEINNYTLTPTTPPL